MKAILLLLVAYSLCHSALARPDDLAVSYRLEPKILNGSLQELDVEIRFRGNRSGITRLELPGDSAGVKDHWHYIADLSIQGATATADGPAHRILRHAPLAPITVSYRLLTAYTADPGGGGNPYDGPVIRPTWFWTQGEFAFIRPEGRETATADFGWLNVPPDWTVAS